MQREDNGAVFRQESTPEFEKTGWKTCGIHSYKPLSRVKNSIKHGRSMYKIVFSTLQQTILLPLLRLHVHIRL